MKLCPRCGKHFSDDANFCPVDAARLSPLEGGASGGEAGGEADPLAARFELGDKLGGATTGEVCKATDRPSGRAVALKIVGGAVMGLPQIAQRIERELKQLERVESPAVARVLASGKRGDGVWVATEYVAGARTLAQYLAAHGRLAGAQAAQLIGAIGEALIEAAKVGVVHRDLAPKNVLLSGGDPGHVKLINFCAPSPTSERAPGVPEYVAPEVIEGKQLDQRSNIYSLGAIYYHAVTGSPPFTGELPVVHAAHLAGGAAAPSTHTGGATDADALVLRALERNPAKRFLTVRQFVDEVQRVARGGEASGAARLAGLGKQRPKEVIQTLMGVPPAAGASGAAAKAEPVIELTTKAPARAPVSVAPPVAAKAPTVPAPVAPAPPAAAPRASVWAPPPGDGAFAATAAAAAQGAAARGVAAVAADVPARPVMPAAPVMPASPSLPAAKPGGAAGGKKKPDDQKAKKGLFRETMWFKKGELDAAAAEAAAEEAARTGKVSAADKADSLPMEDRYEDDGSLSRGDRDKYSLKTGDTTMMPAVKMASGGGTARKRRGSRGVSEDELIGEMKGGRNTMLFVIVLVLAALGGLVAFLSLR